MKVSEGETQHLLPEDQTTQQATGPHAGTPTSNAPKWAILTVLVSVVAYLILDYSLPQLGYVKAALFVFLHWVEQHPIEGIFAFAGVYTLTTILFIPGSILTLGAGFIFGAAFGTAWGIVLTATAVFIGACSGAICAFLLGRYVLQEQAQRWFSKYELMKAVDTAIERKGFMIILLMRLSPVFPFTVLNYMLGLTRAKFSDYCLALVGMLPGTVAFVFVGTSTSSLLDGTSTSGRLITTVLMIVGAIVTVILVTLISVYARRVLNEALEREKK